MANRFIPACAGNAVAGSASAARAAVHPRVCGERWVVVGVLMVGSGSSPRVRGTLPYGGAEAPRDRFIPACAGNAGGPPPSRRRCSVHPRVCGERKRPRPPPRTQQRFIPACAGNARCLRCLPTRRAVHPRVCGERSASCASREARSGSSPRVRGTRPPRRTLLYRVRFIPACAGNA